MPDDPLTPPPEPRYLLQRVQGEGPCSAGFSMQGSRVQDVFYLRPTAEDGGLDEVIELAVKDILGGCRPMGDGRLERSLPRCHPQYPFCFASAVTSLVGIGNADGEGNAARLVEVAETFEAAPISSAYWLHAWARLTVQFDSVPYKVLRDERVRVEVVTWHDENNQVQTSVQANEWERFVDIDYEPAPEFAFADHGMMVFRRGDGGTDWNTPPPHLTTFGGKPRLMLPKATVKVRWFQVPFSYVWSVESYLARYVGRINQLDWWDWEAGQLLYLGLRVLRRYTPPFPDRDDLDDAASFSTDKLCDLELIFEETTRTSPSVPDTTAWNKNWIAAHHNLAYWLKDRKPYLVTSASSTAGAADLPTNERVPLYLSFPFGLFFSDPDVEAG